jgi:ribonuclease R
MSRARELTDQDILSALAGARDGASARELARTLQLHGKQRKQLQEILSRLKHQRNIEEVTSGRYVLPRHKPSPQPTRTQARSAAPSAAASRAAAKGAGAPPDPNLISGRIVVHRDGYGFVVPDAPLPGVEGDLFVPPGSIGDAMHGDSVAARIEKRRLDGRAEGRVVRIVRRAHPTVVGVFRYDHRGNFVEPFETRIGQAIVIPPGEELTPALREAYGAAGKHSRRARVAELDGAVVDVELTRFPAGGVVPAGRVVEVLGRPGEMGVDTEIVIRKHHIPHRFAEDVLAESEATPPQVHEADLASREDFRALPIVTIDGETAKDFDDAVHVRRLPGDFYELQVHIADVAHYVRPGSPLDREARVRGTSVYFPSRAVPMLPEALSNGICSLNPQVDRLVMSAVMEIDRRGAVLRSRFTAGVIRSAERMTYTNVNKVLEGDAEMSARYAAQAEHFRLMRELALILNARRNGRGSIDFDLPEPLIEFDELGRMVTITRSERNIAHRIIEEFMLAANEAVARHLEDRALASLHRIHEKPDPKRVLEFEELAAAFGYSLGVEGIAEREIKVKHGAQPAARHRGGQRERQMTVALPSEQEIAITPHHYQRLTQKIAGKPEERILSYLMLRSLKQARYAAEPLGHFALAADHYTHFTSPIRRYPDLIVHRVLKWALANPGKVGPQGPKPLSPATAQGTATAVPSRHEPAAAQAGPYRVVELEEIAAESSDAERRADSAERELMDWKTAQFMEQHLGEEYDGLIISVLKFGFFVELFEIFVEGLVPITEVELFTGRRCQFRERDRAIVAIEHGRGEPSHGRRGVRAKPLPAGQSAAPRPLSFHLGERVRVRAERIDHFTKRVEFALIEKQNVAADERR